MIPIKVVYLDLFCDLWSKKSLSNITSILSKPIGAQRLGRPWSRPLTMVEVMVDQSFDFLEWVSIETKAMDGRWTERRIPAYYHSKPPYCSICDKSGHPKCRENAWEEFEESLHQWQEMFS